MKRSMYIPASLAAVALTLAACSGDGGSEGGGEGATDAEGQTLNVWIMDGTNPDSSEFFDEVATAFTEQTGAELNVEFVQWADAHDRFVTSIAGGTTPDVAETGTTWTAEFADAGALAALDDYIAEAGIGDDLVDGLVEAGNYDGVQYGMPWYAGVRALIYRADILDDLGLEAPTTWDEIVEVATAVSESDHDVIPFAVPGEAEMSTLPWIWGGGGEVATLEGDTWVSGVNTPEAIAGIEFFTGLATEHGFSSAGATTWNERDVLDNFVQGNIAMAIQGSWTPGTILEQAPELEGSLAATPIPGPDGGISPSLLGGSHLSMFETAENKDLAWAFVELMTTGDFAAEWAAQSGYFPGQESLLAQTMENDDPLVAPFATQMVDGGASLPVTPAYGAVQARGTINAMIQSILSGQKSVQEAADDAAAEIETTMNGN